MENQEGLYIYILDENNIPKMSYIKTAGTVDTNWIVKEGVKAGDRIIATGMQKVIPGSAVRIVKNDTDTKAGNNKPNIFVRCINKIKKMIKHKEM
jgi:membrane fusion protein (multidrug efflux system)